MQGDGRLISIFVLVFLVFVCALDVSGYEVQLGNEYSGSARGKGAES